ncbi:MAG: D-alanine--D-alanine ligase family protein [Anaerolineae bacterium]
MGNKVKIGLIFGGRSGEHEISLMSARGIMNAIDGDIYEVVPIGITKEGRWLASGDPWQALASGQLSESNHATLLAEPSQHGLMRLEDREQDSDIKAVQVSEIDVAFPILHGPYGEDGTVQGLLELAGIPYVGGGVAASAVGMDKVLFKEIMRARGLPIVPHIALKRRDWDLSPEETLAYIEAELGYDCFVKPANLGSSVGVSKAHNRKELCAALDEAARYDRKLLVEAAVDAREIEVSVLGNDEPIASVPGEIVPCNEFYDYAAKYIDERSELLIPAPIPPVTAQRVRELAVQAYLAIDCAGMARADFLLERSTGEIYINELNTLPGFTPISMYPKLWEASGIPYTELIDRRSDKGRSATTYQPSQKG